MSPEGNPPSIVVVGSTMIDLNSYATRVPESGETLFGDRFQMGFGGKGANQAVMARLLGANVAMVNCLGDDVYGGMTLDNFAGYGIDTTHIKQVEGASGVAAIWVEPDGGNRIIIVPGANNALSPQHAAQAVRELAEAQVVVGQLEVPQDATAAGFAQARQAGAKTILNPAPASPLLPELASQSDWLIPNEVEFEMLSGTPPNDQSLVDYARGMQSRLIVTLGSEGVALVTEDLQVDHIAAPLVKAVDTTGAGDSFVGAFAAGLAWGLDEKSAVLLGIRCASDSVTKPGTQSSFPDADQAAAILAQISCGNPAP